MIDKNVELLLYARPTEDKIFHSRITERVEQYSHESRLNGGAWLATWTMPLNEENTRQYLQQFFIDGLFARIEERAHGRTTWDGVIWEMTLSLDGISERVSMAEVYNAIQIRYTETDDSAESWPAQIAGSHDLANTTDGKQYSVSANPSPPPAYLGPMQDSGESWTTDEFVGEVIMNTTDGSMGIVTGNNATQVICATTGLIGGNDNSWEFNDAYEILQWERNQASIDKYGERQLILEGTDIDIDHAESLVLNRLARSANPQRKVIAIDSGLNDQLEITAMGLVATTNNRYVPGNAGIIGTITAADHVRNILELFCDDFLTVAQVDANATTVAGGSTTFERPWAIIRQMVDTGADETVYQFTVESGGRAVYKQVDNTPVYEWHGRERGLTQAGRSRIDSWAVTPGVIRNLTRFKHKPVPGVFLDDDRDSLIESLTMSDGDSMPSLTTTNLDDEDLAATAIRYTRWLEARWPAAPNKPRRPGERT